MLAVLGGVGRRHQPVVGAAPRRRVVDLVLRVDDLGPRREVPRHDGHGMPLGLDPQGGAKADDSGTVEEERLG